MTTPSNPIVRFHKLTRRGRDPVRADRSAIGTLPMRAVRYCEAVTSAASFGWHVFLPMDIWLMWDGHTEISWKYKENQEWLPLQPSAQLPNYVAEFNAVAPEGLKGCSPPFLTALPEPGNLQVWTGLIAETSPDWHLLVRAPANMPTAGGINLYEGIVEADRWFGPLFTNCRLTRSHTPIRLRSDYPLVQVQPIPRHVYSQAVMKQMSVTSGPEDLSAEHWAAYHDTVVEPNSRPNRDFGSYAVMSRKGKRVGITDTPPIGCPMHLHAKQQEALVGQVA